MTLQWTVVAVFLYIEIFIVACMLLPWIRPRIWQKLFKSRLAKMLENYTHIYAWAFAGILLLLFFDAIREVRKYSSAEVALESHVHGVNATATIQMRLFRAQRNLYICGFALFLNFVIKRMANLLSKEAQLEAASEAAMRQAQSASDAAQKLMQDKDTGESKEMIGLKESIEELKKELKKSKADKEAMQKQSEGLQAEYNKLCDDLNDARAATGQQSKTDKKSD